MLRIVTLRVLALAACGGLPSWPVGAQTPGAAPQQVSVPAEPAVPAREPAAAAPAAEPAEIRAPVQPRLQLVPVDVGGEPAPLLRATAEFAPAPAGDPAQREAAAALWLVLQKTPEQGLQDALRLENAERELRSLRAVSQQNAAAVAGMRAQVERAASERNLAAMLVAVLAVVLATMLAAAAWRWYRAARVARVGRWFEANGRSTATVPGPAGRAPGHRHEAIEPTFAAASDGMAESTPGADPKILPLAAAPARAQAAVAVPERAAAARPVPATVGLSPSAPPQDDPAGRGGTVRMVGVEELIDVHDQADFFLTIGKPQQAVAVLEAHIHDRVETSALAWMDLLELYHRLGQRAEFERLRAEFRQNFTGEVPDFDHFDQPSASLEYYARALSRIVALWPSPRVLDVIEESIFRKPGLPGAEPFTLEAYRELLLLYHVASEIAGPHRAGGVRDSDTALQPLNAMQLTERPAAEPDTRLVPPSSPNVGLDIDLGADEAPVGLTAVDFDISGSDALQGAPAAARQG
jgi:hypothetical protein